MSLPQLGPYGKWARKYAKNGMMCIPLPPRSKTAPPVGFSGGGHKDPSLEQIEKWCTPGTKEWGGEEVGKYETAYGNIAWVLPNPGPELEYIGIDVDAYADKTGTKALAELEKLAGRKLPETYHSSGRGSKYSDAGIRLYVVPSGLKWPGNLTKLTGVPGIDIIQGGHRYIVLPPSVHPDTQQPYRWNTKLAEFLNDEEDFPRLPDVFVELITSNEPAVSLGNVPKMTKDELHGWIAGLVAGDACGVTDRWLQHWKEQLEEATDGNGIHDASLLGIISLARAGAEGHVGVPAALDSLREAHLTARATSKRGARTASSEWSRMLKDGGPRAIALTEQAGKAQEKCDCEAIANSRWAEFDGEEDEKPVIQDRNLGQKRSWDDLGNADRLCDYFGRRIAWAHDAQIWLVFDGKRWEKSGDDVPVRHYAREALRLAGKYETPLYSATPPEPKLTVAGKPDTRAKEAPTAQESFGEWLAKQRYSARISSMITEFRSIPSVRVRIDDFDKKPFLFNAKNGTINLETGKLQNFNPRDRLTQMTEVVYDPEAQCLQWEKFLREVQPSREMRGYLARVVGYTMTGSTAEQAMFIHHGEGANGKSVFLKVMDELFGDYYQAMPKTAILNKSQEDHPTGIARIVGKRFLSASETKAGAHLDDETVKALTAGDKQTAHFMKKDFFEFVPVGKIHLATNFLPTLSSSGKAIGRRLHAIGWDVTIPPEKMIKNLDTQICRRELPGILNWAIAGCQEYLSAEAGADALDRPLSVIQKTQEHIGKSNRLSDWLEERAEFDRKADPLPLIGIYEDYKTHCEQWGNRPVHSNQFSRMLVENGAIKCELRHPVSRTAMIAGIRLREGSHRIVS